MNIRKLLAAFLAAALAFTLALPASADFDPSPAPPQSPNGAASQDSLTEALEALQQKYNISVTYDLDHTGSPAISPSTLRMLDTSLDYVTPGIVQQVSNHYQSTLGRRLTFHFAYSNQAFNDTVEVVGMFNDSTATINLFLPTSGSTAFNTGASPLTVVHEFAHALHVMCENRLGKNNLQMQWLELNGQATYTGRQQTANYDHNTFVSSYGATSYHEDFAEVFSHALVRNKPGLGFSGSLIADGSYTALGRKLLYIENLLPQVFNSSEVVIANLRQSFAVPEVLEYQGLTLSGQDLQFIDFAAPANVRLGILNYYNVIERSSEWIRELGGWQVEASDGNYYLVFPGGTIAQLDGQLQTAA